MVMTERLLIRKIGQEDLDLVFDLNSAPECAYLNGWTSIPVEVCKDTIDMWMEQYAAADGIGTFCVEDRVDKCKIGIAYLLEHDEPNQLLLGFRLRKACWNRGYEREITQELMKYVEHNLDANTIIAKIYQHDLRERNIFEELEFKISGCAYGETGLLYKYSIDKNR